MCSANHCHKVTRSGGWLTFIALLVSMHAHAATSGKLADAAMRGELVAVKSLLQAGANPNDRGQFGTQALHWLVDADDLAGVQLLLQAGADASGQTERGVRPLGLAIANGNGAIVELLLQAGANPNQTEPSGETQLMMAAQAGSLPVVNLLLQRGAVVGTQEPAYGQTALTMAARAGHAGIVAALLAHGARHDVATRLGAPPALDLAWESCVVVCLPIAAAASPRLAA
jgi:ankyrin repeat protein